MLSQAAPRHAMLMPCLYTKRLSQPFVPPSMQLLGFSDLYAASLMATFSIGCALGGLLGESWFDVCAAATGCMHMQGKFAQHGQVQNLVQCLSMPQCNAACRYMCS